MPPPPGAQKSTHVLVPKPWMDALRGLSAATRVNQSEYLREAVDDVLAKYSSDLPARWWRAPSDDGHPVSLVFRVTPGKLAGLKALSERTRVRQSEYLREALCDLLAKYGRPVDTAPEPTQPIPAAS